MDRKNVIELLQDLVRIPSVNPFGDPGTAETGEGKIAGYIADYLRDCGADVEIRDVEPGRPNVIGLFTPARADRAIALGPHMDTVSIEGMTIDPFSAEIRGGKLYGRGSVDTKGSMAAFLDAVSRVVCTKEFAEGGLGIAFCALMGEESGNDGVRALVEEGFSPDFAVVGEPTGNRIVYTHKGALWIQVATHGRTAHGSMPERGESAIGKMAEVIRELLGPYAADLRAKSAKTLGAPTVNIGVIKGGSQTNIVPSCCMIDIDRRTIPGEYHEDVIREISDRLADYAPEINMIRDCPPLYTDPRNEFVRGLCSVIGEDALIGAPWFCDAGIFSEHGIPAVAFGPGDGTMCHTPDEYIEIDQVLENANLMERFLLSAIRDAFR